VTLLSPVPLRLVPHAVPALPQTVRSPARTMARFTAPQPALPRPVTRRPELPAAPVIQIVPLAPALAPGPAFHAAPPPPQVVTGKFTSAPEPAPSTPALPLALKPAGFGKAESGAVAENRGPIARTAGFDAAVARGAWQGRGVIARAAGFESAATGPAAVEHRPAAHAANFGDASVTSPHASVSRAAVPETTPVEILEKPRPVYTEEARRAAIEGEVLLEVLFQASGQVRVLRVIRGLGHGLDEAAAAAAREIRFRPARRQGTPADSTAQVHIVFQLAY